MIFPYGEPVTILTRTPGPADRYGNPTYTWVSAEVKGVFVPEGSVESTLPYREAVTTQPAVYVPTGTVVTPRDRVTVRGSTYDVDGDPLEFVNPFTGWAPAVVVKLKRTEG